MLKITKGLRPFVEDGITPYTDSKGDKYVRVKMGDEDFCIAAHDYSKGDENTFTWDDAMEQLEAKEMTTFTKEQAKICLKHLKEINNELKKIGGDVFEDDWYWTSIEFNTHSAWFFNWGFYNFNSGEVGYKSCAYSVRPTLNTVDL